MSRSPTRSLTIAGWIILGALLVLAAARFFPPARANAINVQALGIELGPAVASPVGSAPTQSASPAVQAAQVRLALAQGDHAQAFQRALSLLPLRCDLALRLGDAAWPQEPARAIDFWDDCPQAAGWLTRHGDAALASGDRAAAEAWYRPASALPADTFDTSLALLKLGSLLQQESWAEALPVYEEYRTLAEQGVLPELVFDERTKRDVSQWDLIQAGHQVREVDGDCTRAIFWYTLADRRNPENALAALYRGVCAGSAAEALRWFDEAIARDPRSDRGHYWKGVTLQGEEECTAAIESFQEAARLDPSNVNTLLRLGACYEAVGQTETARGAYARALELDPERAAARDALQRLHGTDTDSP